MKYKRSNKRGGVTIRELKQSCKQQWDVEEKELFPKVKKNQKTQNRTGNQGYISRSTNTHFRRAAHSNEKNEPARFKEHAYTTGRTTRRSRLNRNGRVRFDGIRRAGLRNTNHDAAAVPQNNGE